MSSAKSASSRRSDAKSATTNRSTSSKRQTQQRNAIDRSLNFINSLLADDLQYACFDEKLKTFSDTNQEVGQLCLSVSTTVDNGEEQIVVCASSAGIVDGISCGTTIMAYLTMTGETIEQKHHEYVNLVNHPIKRDTRILQEDDSYVLEIAIQRDDEVKDSSTMYSMEEMKAVVPEGLNILLLRLLAMKGLPSEGLELQTFNADMAVCAARYRSLPQKVITVQGKELDTVGIERSLYSGHDKPVTWQSYFATDGRLVQRTQLGSKITMRLCEITLEDAEDDDAGRPVIVQKPLDWEKDLELHSKFLDKKDELKASHATYLRRNPEVQAIVADFLQHLLLRKPADALAEATRYFTAFHGSESAPSALPPPPADSASPSSTPAVGDSNDLS